MARFKIWQVERVTAEKLKMADLRCPGDFCQQVCHYRRWKCSRLSWRSKPCPSTSNSLLERDPTSHRLGILHRKANEASTTDARRLCIGWKFEQATGNKSLGLEYLILGGRGSRPRSTLPSRSTEAASLAWVAQLTSNINTPVTKRLVDEKI